MSFSGSTTTGTNGGCCGAKTCLGGAVWTQGFPIIQTSEVYFSYTAAYVSDWYEAAIVLYRLSDPLQTVNGVAVDVPLSSLKSAVILQAKIVRGDSASVTGDSNEGKFSQTVAGPGFYDQDGTIPYQYVIAFFVASYDASNGGALGASMAVQDFGRNMVYSHHDVPR